MTISLIIPRSQSLVNSPIFLRNKRCSVGRIRLARSLMRRAKMFQKQQDGDHAYRNPLVINQEMLLHKTLSEEVQGK